MRRPLWWLLPLALALTQCATPPPPPPSHGQGTSGSAAASGKHLDLVLAHYGSPGQANLGALPGKVVLIDFWATWCGPCHEAARAYERLYQAYRARGLEVYGVSVDDNPEPIGQFLAEQGVTYPILLDPAAQVSGPRFEIDAIPLTVLADKKGQIRFTHHGFEGDAEPQIRAEVEQLLAEP